VLDEGDRSVLVVSKTRAMGSPPRGLLVPDGLRVAPVVGAARALRRMMKEEEQRKKNPLGLR
jgi:hypothetical protein